jgi:drug/metabolite transporter (DMT)-like permease
MLWVALIAGLSCATSALVVALALRPVPPPRHRHVVPLLWALLVLGAMATAYVTAADSTAVRAVAPAVATGVGGGLLDWVKHARRRERRDTAIL